MGFLDGIGKEIERWGVDIEEFLSPALKYKDDANPTRGPGDYNTPWQKNLGREINPNPGTNPLVGGYLNRYGRALDTAGKNPAARAALLSRARGLATRRMIEPATGAFGRYQGLVLALQQARNNIDTTTADNAYISGFLGTGS